MSIRKSRSSDNLDLFLDIPYLTVVCDLLSSPAVPEVSVEPYCVFLRTDELIRWFLIWSGKVSNNENRVYRNGCHHDGDG